MAGKITDLTALAAPSATDLIEIVDDVGGTPTNKKIAWDDILTALIAALFGTDVSVTGNIEASGDIEAGDDAIIHGDAVVTGDVKGTTFHVGADAGVDATFDATDLATKTVTVKKGIITDVS